MKMKITYKHFITYVLLIGLFIVSACDSNLSGVNDNPNAPTDVPPSLILPRAQQTSLDRLYSMSGLNGYAGGVWAQSYAKIQYVDEDKYDYSGRVSLVNNIWQSFYARTLEDLNQIIIKATDADNPQPNVEAIATILKAWNYQTMTDLWGDIPYSEALKGSSAEPITSPKYDTQKDVYAGILSELKHAATIIDESSAPFGGEDLIFGGDMSGWKKLANSLRLRILLRQADKEPLGSEMQAIYDAGNYISESSDNATLEYQKYPYNNPVNNFHRTREDHKISDTQLGWLNEMNDPRLRIYAAPTGQQPPLAPIASAGPNYGAVNVGGLWYQGVNNGDVNNSISLSSASPLGAYFLSPVSPGVIMTAAETHLILAEADMRGLITTSKGAEWHYYEGIKQSMKQYDQASIDPVLSALPGDQTYDKQGLDASQFPSGITDAEYQSYISQGMVDWNNTGTLSKHQKIAIQKWFALYGQGAEVWFEWRRLDYPSSNPSEMPGGNANLAIQPGPEAVLSSVPVRYPYPQVEESLNGANRKSAMDNQGISTQDEQFLTPVWWDN